MGNMDVEYRKKNKTYYRVSIIASIDICWCIKAGGWMTVVIVVARPSVMIGDMVERYREGVRSICTLFFSISCSIWLASLNYFKHSLAKGSVRGANAGEWIIDDFTSVSLIE